MLAIVIPYYKIDYFEETLKSLANQTDKRFKVYIGDDASNTSPKPLLEKYQSNIHFKYIRFSENLGSKSLTGQWQRCIAMAQNKEWINILGDDDVLGESVVASFYKNFENINSRKINVVRFASKVIDGSGNDLSSIYTHPKIEMATDAYYKKFICESRGSLSEYIFKKESYNKYKFTNYPLGWHSDDKAWLDYTKGGEIYSINDAVFKIRRSDQSISGKEDNLILKNKARRLFIKDIITKKEFSFSALQKSDFLFEYGILIKEQGLITLSSVCFGCYHFLKLGMFYNAARFLRRMYRAKFLGK